MERTEKKNQHYIPKFYLRNFSYKNFGKQIGVYNLENKLYIAKAALKDQGSKNFFYGIDGYIEDGLSDIEGKLATVIRHIIDRKNVPPRGSLDHRLLLIFVTLTDLRNPIKIDGMKAGFEEMRKMLLDAHPDTDVKKFVPEPSHEEMVRMHLSYSVEMAEMMSDLDCKIFINGTSNPFITSNFPVVKYNQFLEMKKWRFSKCGYGLVGLQMFIPVNHEITLVFYDPAIYKLGDKKKSFYTITNEKDVDEINKLQFLNCLDTIFFDERATESYIRKLAHQTKSFTRANVTTSELSYLIKDGDAENKRIIESGYKNFMRIGKTDCEIDLRIDGLKIHSRGKDHKLNNTQAQLRPHAASLRYGYD